MPSKYTRRNPLLIPAFLLLIALLIAIGVLVYGYFHYERENAGLRDALTVDNAALQTQLTEAQAANDELTSANNALMDANAFLQTQLTEAQTANNELTAANEALIATNEETAAARDALPSENATLQTQLTEVQAANVELTA